MMATVSNAFVYPVTFLVVIFGSDLSLSGERHIPTWEAVPLHQPPPSSQIRQIPKTTSEFLVSTVHKYPTSYYFIFKRSEAWFIALDQDNSGQISAEELRWCDLLPH